MRGESGWNLPAVRAVRSHTFNGRKFVIDAEGRIGGYTECPGAVIVSPEIYIDDTLPGMKHLEISVHESLHACFDAATEAQVQACGRDIARFLWRLGYRRSS